MLEGGGEASLAQGDVSAYVSLVFVLVFMH